MEIKIRYEIFHKTEKNITTLYLHKFVNDSGESIIPIVLKKNMFIDNDFGGGKEQELIVQSIIEYCINNDLKY